MVFASCVTILIWNWTMYISCVFKQSTTIAFFCKTVQENNVQIQNHYHCDPYIPAHYTPIKFECGTLGTSGGRKSVFQTTVTHFRSIWGEQTDATIRFELVTPVNCYLIFALLRLIKQWFCGKVQKISYTSIYWFECSLLLMSYLKFYNVANVMSENNNK